MRTLITGATGLIGRHVITNIQDPVVLSRNPSEARRSLGGVDTYGWSPEAGSPPSEIDHFWPSYRLTQQGPASREEELVKWKNVKENWRTASLVRRN